MGRSRITHEYMRENLISVKICVKTVIPYWYFASNAAAQIRDEKEEKQNITIKCCVRVHLREIHFLRHIIIESSVHAYGHRINFLFFFFLSLGLDIDTNNRAITNA